MSPIVPHNTPQGQRENLTGFHESKDLLYKVAQGISTTLNTLKPSVRVYLLRHYPYEDTSEWREYEVCLKKRFTLKDDGEKARNLTRILELKDSGKINILRDFADLSGEIQDIYRAVLCNPTKTALFYHQEAVGNGLEFQKSKGRTEITGENLRKHFPDIGLVQAIDLPGSSKDGDTGVNDHKTNAEIKSAIFTALKQTQGKFETIVIIGNRSYAEGFYVTSGRRELSHIEVEELFEEKGYSQMDITVDANGMYEQVVSEVNKLVISPHNKREIIESINTKEGKNMLSGSDSTQEIEMHVSHFFQANRNRFREYFEDENVNEEIRIFCLTNLLGQKSSDTEEFIMSYIHKCKASQISIPLSFLEILLCSSNQDVISREALLVSILFVKDVPRYTAIVNLCKKTRNNSMFNEISEIIEMLRSSNTTVKEIFGKSLDALVQNKKLISRKLYFYRRKTEKEISKLIQEKQSILSKEEEYERLPVSISFILDSKLPSILIGHVGEGKSTELAHMKEEIDINPQYGNYIPLFYSAKTHNRAYILDKIQKEIQSIIECFPSKQIVVFFDGIDELNGDIRESTMLGLKNLSSSVVKIILGSRPIGFDKYENSGIQTIHFDKIEIFDRNQFLKSRLQNLGVLDTELNQKLAEIYEFLNKSILSDDLKETPLILFFLSKLCVNNELKDIKNRADLYGKIILKLLGEHQGEKDIEGEANRFILNEDHYVALMETLSFCAFQMHRGKELKREDIKKYLESSLSRNTSAPTTEKLERLVDKIFLLYQLEGGGYQFILKSFEEYFLARYFASILDGNSEIYKTRDASFENWNSWRNFRPVVLFYGELLTNKGDIDRIEKLLKSDGLLKNDDIFGENFFMGFEILYSLSEQAYGDIRIKRLLEIYEQTVMGWEVNTILKGLEGIFKFVNGIGKMNPLVSNRAALLITNCTVKLLTIEAYNVAFDIYKKLALCGSDAGVRMVIKFSRDLIEARQYFEAGEVYQFLIESNSKEGIKAVIDAARDLMKTSHYSEASEIYSALISSGNEEGIRLAIDAALDLTRAGKHLEAELIYISLISSGNEERVKAAIDAAGDLTDARQRFEKAIIITSHISSSNEVGIRLTMDAALDLIRVGKRHSVIAHLVNSGNEEGVRSVIDAVRDLTRAGKYLEARLVYSALISSGNEEGIRLAIDAAGDLMKAKKYSEASEIYLSLINSGNEESIGGALLSAAMLITENDYIGSSEIYRAVYALPKIIKRDRRSSNFLSLFHFLLGR